MKGRPGEVVELHLAFRSEHFKRVFDDQAHFIYASQQASKRDRASNRSWKLRQALGCDEDFRSLPTKCISKPKGMHWHTFERKIGQLKEVNRRAQADAIAAFRSLMRRFEAVETAYRRAGDQRD